MTQIADIRGKSADELKDMAALIKKELFNLRFQAASGEAVQIARFRSARKDIARIKTVMNDPQQKNAGAAKPAKKEKAPAAKKPAAKKKTKE